MARFLRENTATRITVGPFLDVTDGITPELALTVTGIHLTLMVDDVGVPTLALDADATASGGNNDMVHVTNDNAGFYDLELTAAQVNFTGRAMFAAIDDSEHLPVFHEFQIVRANVYDAMFIDSDLLDVSVTQLAGGAQSLTDLKDFADAGYDPATNKVEGVKLVDTTTTNTDLVDGPTKAEMDTGHGLLATEAKQDVIDGIVDNVLIDTAVIGAAGVGLSNIPWNASWDAEVESEAADALAAFFTSAATLATLTVDEWETQSQADPTGFWVNLREWIDTAPLALAAQRVVSDVGAISGDAGAADRLEGLMDGVIIAQVNAGTPTTTTFAADGFTEATDDHFNGRLVTFLTGALAGQQSDITDYDATGNGAGEQAIIVSAMTEAPSNDDFFMIH